MMMGSETVLVSEPDLFVTESDYKSATTGRMLRYVRLNEQGQPVAALQVRTKGLRSKKAVIANVYTASAERRTGLASGLLRRAQQDLDVKHSNDLTNDGAAFKAADGVRYQDENAPRAEISLPSKLGDRAVVIKLFREADPSSFMHEAGHLFLELFRETSAHDQQLSQDWETIREFLGMEGQVATDEQHETFARAFEAYLREGKSPTEDLNPVFEMFREWLVKVYESVTQLRVEINDDLRGVFDRMLVAQQHGDAVTAYVESQASFTPAELQLLSDGDRVKYAKLRERANGAAESALRQKLLADIERRRTREFNARRAELRRDVKEDVQRRPVYRAMQWFRNRTQPEGFRTDLLPDGYIDIDIARAAYGDAFVDDFRAKRRGIIREEPGRHPDEVAEAFGYESGMELLVEMVDAPKIDDVVEAEVAELLDAEFPDLYDDGALMQAAATEAALGEHRLALLGEELTQLVKMGGEALLNARARDAAAVSGIREPQATKDALAAAERQLSTAQALGDPAAIRAAQDELKQAEALRRAHIDARRQAAKAKAVTRASVLTAGGTVRDIMQAAARRIATVPWKLTEPSAYMRASLKASERGALALSARDYNQAAGHKYDETMNAALHAQAHKARREWDEIQKWLTKAARTKSVPDAYQAHVLHLLDLYGIRPRNPNDLKAPAESLLAFDEQKMGEGFELSLGHTVVNRTAPVNFKETSLEEMRELKATVRSLQKVGRAENELNYLNQKRELKATAAELTQRAMDKHGYDPDAPLRDDRPGPLGQLMQFGKAAHLWHMKVETLMESMDGGRDGPWWTHVFKPMAEAAQKKQQIENDLYPKFEELLNDMTWQERAALNTRINVNLPGIEKWTKERLLALALNIGNRDNMTALTEGYGWTEEQIHDALAQHLTAKDWKFVQRSWDIVGSLWPEIQDLQERMTGSRPEGVTGDPVRIIAEDGTVLFESDGAYYPLAYDPQGKRKTDERAQVQDIKELFGGNVLTPYTRRGHTKERVGAGGQKPWLTLDVMTNHISNVAHDLAYREAVASTHRLLKQPDVAKALGEVFSPGATGAQSANSILNDWLTDVATDRHGEVHSNPLGTFVRTLRTGATVVNMGFKFTTAAVQMLGITQSLDRMGVKQVADGYLYTIKNGGLPAYREAVQKSTYMQERMRTFDRDLKDQYTRLARSNLPRLRNRANMYLFGMIQFMDTTVSLPTWHGAYRNALREGKTEDQAVHIADREVRLTQSSGAVQDLAKVQRGSEFQKVLTMFYSYFNAYYNMQVRAFGEAKTHAQEGRYFQAAGRAVLSQVYLTMLPAVLGDYLLQRFDDDDEDWVPDEGFGLWALKKTVAYPFMSVVGVRDVVNAASSGYGYSWTPIVDAGAVGARLLDDIGDAATYAFTDEDERREADKVTKDVLMLSGYLTGLIPSRQLWLSGNYLNEYANGEINNFSLYDFLLKGAPR